MAYDANGNTLSDASGKQYSWDFDNQLTSVTVPGSGTTTFRYDPWGRRIQKSGPLGTTNFLYDGPEFMASLIEEVDNSGNVLARYTQDLGVDSPLSMLRSGATDYFERDGLGSVTSLSNSAGALANTYTFDSFGKLTASTGTLTNRFQYAGREFDSETGLYYNRARYYDRNVGRFISEDPTEFRGGIDFYGGWPISRYHSPSHVSQHQRDMGHPSTPVTHFDFYQSYAAGGRILITRMLVWLIFTGPASPYR